MYYLHEYAYIEVSSEWVYRTLDAITSKKQRQIIYNYVMTEINIHVYTSIFTDSIIYTYYLRRQTFLIVDDGPSSSHNIYMAQIKRNPSDFCPHRDSSISIACTRITFRLSSSIPTTTIYYYDYDYSPL